MMDTLYNDEILTLAARPLPCAQLPVVDGAAYLRSKLCGSSLDLKLGLNSNKTIMAFCVTIKACVLGHACAALLCDFIPELTYYETCVLHGLLTRLITQGIPIEYPRFTAFNIFEGVHAYKARHTSTLLGINALKQAYSIALAIRLAA